MPENVKTYTLLHPGPKTGNENVLRKEEILDWLLDAPDPDVQWIWSAFRRQRREVMLDEAQDRVVSRRMSLSRDCLPSATDPPTDDTLLPVVQFSSAIYFVNEKDGKIELDVIRIGDTRDKTVVSFTTQDDSAFAGQDYVWQSGSIVFEPGESRQKITVEVLEGSMWKATIDFKVLLTSEKLSGATLGLHLFVARVKLLDDTTFPTDTFKNVGLDNWVANAPHISRGTLLFEYCRMNWNIPKVRVATIKWILVDWYDILTDALDLFLTVYLLDFVLNTDRTSNDLLFIHSRQGSLLLLALVRFVIFLLRYWFDYARLSFGLVGASELYIKSGLLRTFLNYNKDVREKLQPGDVLMAIDRDVDKVVNHGYLGFLHLARLLGSVASKILFMIVSPIIIGEEGVHLSSLLSLLGLPVVLGLFLYCRKRTVQHYLEVRHDEENEVTTNVAMTTASCELIFGYSLRNYVSRRFDDACKKYFEARKESFQVNLNNDYFASWVTFLTIAIFTFYGGLRVIRGEMRVGMFVTNLKVFQSVGDAFVSLYETVSTMQTVRPSMFTLAKLLNLPTDIGIRKELQNQKQRKTAKRETSPERDEDISNNVNSKEPTIDQMPIKLHFEKIRNSSLRFSGKFFISQGQLVAVLGESGCGKATLLRLLSNTLLSKEAMQGIFVPSHLRPVNVAETILFFNGTLKQNLTFGIADHHKNDKSDARIYSICKEVLQMGDRVISYLMEQESQEQKWNELFSGSECRLLMIARALLFNAELITFHKPLVSLCQSQAKTALYALKQHVAEKGLCQNSKLEGRRPRTVFFSSSTTSSLIERTADYLIDITPSGTLTKSKSQGGTLMESKSVGTISRQTEP